MTLLYDNGMPAVAGTHVLVIGVGRYPFLIDGYEGKLADKPLGLGQLQSPPVSAKKFIDWCLAPLLVQGSVGFVNISAPLASVEALISAKNVVSINTPDGSKQLDVATRDNIQVAFEAWLDRVANHENNIGVFYFCGHGVMVSNHFLLAADFGRSKAQPWAHAFDVSNTLRAMEREVKGALYFFVDACREFSREIALSFGGDPHALKVVDPKKPVIRTSATLIEAAGEGKLAFSSGGGEVSRFTEALITAMSGYCGIKKAGSATWDVDGESLANAIRRLLEKGNVPLPGKKPAPPKQICDQSIGGLPVPLLRINAVPMVKVELDLTPEQKRALYELYLTSAKGVHYSQKGINSIFRTEVPRGFYEVGARGGAGVLGHVLHPDEELIPPLYELPMQAP